MKTKMRIEGREGKERKKRIKGLLKKCFVLMLALTIFFSPDIMRVSGMNGKHSSEYYANFRNVKAGCIGQNNLYRSQHPANGSMRSRHANELAKKHKIQTVLNLSDSKSELERYFRKYKIPAWQYYRTLYRKGRVYTADLSPRHNSSSYRRKLVLGLRFLLKHQGPYLIHCQVGRDRTGFAILVLEGLTSVPYYYMRDDYAKSLVNVNKCSWTKAQKKAEQALIEEFRYMSGQRKLTNLAKLNLKRYAVLYLKKGGMSMDEIKALKRKLSVSYSR